MKKPLFIAICLFFVGIQQISGKELETAAITICSTKECKIHAVDGTAITSTPEGQVKLASINPLNLFDTSLWPARWHCGTWTPLHGWIYIISDLLIWLSYFTIPGILAVFILRRKVRGDIPFQRVFLLFIAFILACGLTHLIDAAIFWWPAYKLSAALRLGTAGVSVMTVFALVKVLPDAIQLKSPAALEKVVQIRTQELRVLTEKLQQEILEKQKSDENLKQTNQELLAFSYSVSHDLRAPLRSIHGFSNALSEDYRDKLDSAGQDYLDRICKASVRMSELIDDLLTLSRISKDEIVIDEVNLSQMVEEVVSLQLKQDSRIQATFEIQKNIVAQGDRKLLKIVFENLIDNAIKYSSKKEHPIINFGKLPDQEVYFIQDNGVGFNMEFSGKLFGAFQRLHDKEYEGSGIGLATVKRIIIKHGGKIWAHGEENKGATFYFMLN